MGHIIPILLILLLILPVHPSSHPLLGCRVHQSFQFLPLQRRHSPLTQGHLPGRPLPLDPLPSPPAVVPQGHLAEQHSQPLGVKA